ncbi:MAG: hypothetical protein ACFFDN_50440 [Candidatus Hodarchaeota archaeon]
MIKGIFVIYDTGICLYNKSNKNIPPNEQLVSGFIAAIDRFCKTSIGENISYICTETLKFHFIRKNKLIFVFLSDKNDITNKLLPNFKQIMNKFLNEFTNQQRYTFEKNGLIPELSNFDSCISNLYI